MNLKQTKTVMWGLLVACVLLAALTKVTGSTVVGVLMVVPLIGLAVVAYLFWRCPHCGKHLSRNLNHFCPHCGKNLPDWTEL